MPCSRPLSRLSALLVVATLAVGARVRAEDTPCPSQWNPPAVLAPAPKSDCDPADKECFDLFAEDSELDTRTGDANLKGNVILRQGDKEVRANDVEYKANDTKIKVNGALEYVDPVVHVTGTDGNYSTSGGADFNAAEFELRTRPARGAADELSLSSDGLITLDGVHFTTCPREDEAWRIRADKITLDTRKQLGTGRNARVDFKGVPIIYLPWMSFPLGTERKSGFLFPSFGHTTRSGFQIAIPYYWNIAPAMDLTFEPVYYASRGLDAAGEFRYLTSNQKGALSINYLPDDQETGESRHRIKLDHVAQLPHAIRFTADAQNVSDTNYFVDFGQGPEGTSVAFLERFAQLQYRDEHWLLAAEAQNFQTIDRELLDTERPYSRVPRLLARGDYGWGPAQQLHYGFDSEVVNFQRSAGVTGWRVDAMPRLQLDIDGPGYFVRPAVAWRYTQYQLDDQEAGTEGSPSRTLPIASLDTGLIFERAAGSHSQRRLTLEPRLFYLNVPYRDQADLPLFDTALPDLNLVQLFRTNRYVGADRVSDANQVSVGVTTRLLSAEDGRQFLAATLGQIHYFEAPRVLLPDETRRSGNTSDLVAQLALTGFQDWNAEIGMQWNPEDGRKERAQARLQYVPGAERVFNVGYRFQRDLIEQAEASAAWPVSKHWNVYARYVHSFEDNKALERFAGLEYRSCCWRLRVLGRRFISDSKGTQDTGIYLQLELTGLASVGSAADAFLSSAVRGYTRNDPPR